MSMIQFKRKKRFAGMLQKKQNAWSPNAAVLPTHVVIIDTHIQNAVSRLQSAIK
jgi:hypothetical protein